MNRFQKTKHEPDEFKQNKKSKQAFKQEALQKVLDQNFYNEQQKSNQESKAEDSKLTNEMKFEKKESIKQMPQLIFKTQPIANKKKLFDFEKFAQNSQQIKQKKNNSSQLNQIIENPQPMRQDLRKVENIIGKALLQRGEIPAHNLRITQNLYDMIEPKPITGNEQMLLEEEKFDFKSTELHQKFQSKLFQPFDQSFLSLNENEVSFKKPTDIEQNFMDFKNEESKKPTITELFFQDNEENILNESFNQPSLLQKTLGKNIQQQELKQIQPKNFQSQISEKIDSIQEQKNQQNFKQISFGTQNIKEENQMSEKKDENQLFEQELFDMTSILTPGFRKRFGKLESINQFDISSQIDDIQNQKADQKKNTSQLEVQQENQSQSENIFEENLKNSENYQKSKTQKIVSKTKKEYDMYDQNKNLEESKSSINKIHEKQNLEEEKTFDSKEMYQTQISNELRPYIEHLGENENNYCIIQISEKRKASLSQYCQRHLFSDSYTNNFESSLYPNETELESDDVQQKGLKDLNDSLNDREDSNFEGQDTYAGSSDLDMVSYNYHRTQALNSSPRFIQESDKNINFKNKDFFRIQNEDRRGGLGGISQFDELNHQEEMIKDTETVQNDIRNNEMMFSIGLEINQQNSSSSIQNMHQANRKRINSFNKNNQPLGRINNQEIDFQIEDYQPQPLRRQNAIIERNQSNQISNEINQENVIGQIRAQIGISSQQQLQQLEDQQQDALIREFRGDSFEINEEELLLQQQQLQLRMTENRLNNEINYNGFTQINSEDQNVLLSSNIEQEFLSQNDSNHQNQDMTFLGNSNDLNQGNQDLLQNLELPQLSRSSLNNQRIIESDGIQTSRSQQTSNQNQNTQSQNTRLINMINEINQRQINQDSKNSSEADSLSSQRYSECDFNNLQDFDMEKLRFLAKFQYGHPKWIEEIEDNMNEGIFQKSKDIIQNLGVLSLLIFQRLFLINENLIQESKILQEKKAEHKSEKTEQIWTENYIECCEQMSFNNQNKKKGVPCMTQTFLIYLAQRMINIVHFERNKNNFVMDQVQKHQSKDAEKKQLHDDQIWKNFSEIKDKVFPSIEEVYYCIKHKIINKKEIILYKMIIDFNESLLNKNIENQSQIIQTVYNSNTFSNNIDQQDLKTMNDVFLPCTIKFYKQLNQQEVTDLVEKMQELNMKIASQIEVESKIEKMKKQMSLQSSSLKNNHFMEALQRPPLSIFQTENIQNGNIFGGNSEFLENDITQLILQPVQYFLKEKPLNNQEASSKIFAIKKISDYNCSSQCCKSQNQSNQFNREDRVDFVLLKHKEEFEKYYKNIEILIRNNNVKTLKSTDKVANKDVKRLLVHKGKGSLWNVCEQQKQVDSFQDRQDQEKRVPNKARMSWNKKRNAMMHNGSYFLKNILV